MTSAGQVALIFFGVMALLAATGAGSEGNVGVAVGGVVFGVGFLAFAVYLPTYERESAAWAAANAEAARREAARLAYEAAPKCPYCGQPNSWREKSRTIVRQARAFGMVERLEVHRGIYGDPQKVKEIRRQERVPVLTTTTRVETECAYCRQTAAREFTETREDFSPEPPGAAVTAQRVTINLPPPPPQIVHRCRYCNTAYPEAARACPSCGAVF